MRFVFCLSFTISTLSYVFSHCLSSLTLQLIKNVSIIPLSLSLFVQHRTPLLGVVISLTGEQEFVGESG